MSTSTEAAPAVRATATRMPPAVHYTVHSLRLTIKNVSFVLFSVGLPVLLYLAFSQAFGGQDGSSAQERADVSAGIMISMGAYGALGAALSGGAQLALERRSGWFRQLMITALPARSFLWSKAAVIMMLTLPSLLLVFTAGVVVGGVRLPVGTWLLTLVLMWLALVPLAGLGIVLGLWVKAEAVQGVTTLVLLLLALLGGLWIPTALMPAAMQQLSQGLPSYWVAAFGRWALQGGPAGGPFPWTGVVVLAGWLVVVTVLGSLGYRRAAATSKR